MEAHGRRRVIFAAAVLFFLAANAYAQKEEGNHLFRWKPVKNADGYILTIEKAAANGEYSLWMRTSTAETKIELPVESGLYRYNLQAKDVFGNLSPPSKYLYFNFNTRVFEWTPVTGASAYRFTLERAAGDLDDYTPVLVQDAKASAIDISSLAGGRYRWRVSARDDFGNSSEPCEWVYFEIESEERVESPPAAAETERAKRFVFDLGISWTPLVPAGGVINEVIGEGWFPETLALDCAVFPLARGRFLFGGAAEFFWSNMAWNSAKSDRFLLEGHFLGFNLAPAIQIKLSGRLSLAFRVGGGGVLFNGFKFRDSLSYGGSSFFVADVFAGGSVIFFITGAFYIKAGAEYLHIFNADKPENSYVKPLAGFGARF